MSYSRIEYCFNDYFNKLNHISKKYNINLKQSNVKGIILIKIKFDTKKNENITKFINFIETNIGIEIINYHKKKGYLILETNDLHVLNNQLKEIKSLILVMLFEEINILINIIQKYNEFLTLISYNFSYLDMILSFTKLVKIKNYKKPIIDEKFNNLFIEGFINPIFLNKIESFNEKHIFNQFMSLDYQTVNYIIGENFSGKTILLKTILYIVILFHIGCFVPCFNLVLRPFKLIITKFSYNIDTEVKGSGLEKELLRIKDIFINLNSDNNEKNNLILIDNLISSSSNQDIYQISTMILYNLFKFKNLKCIITSRDFNLNIPSILVSNNYISDFKLTQEFMKQPENNSIKLYEVLSNFLTNNELFYNILKNNDEKLNKNTNIISKTKDETVNTLELENFFKGYINLILKCKEDFNNKYIEYKDQFFLEN